MSHDGSLICSVHLFAIDRGSVIGSGAWYTWIWYRSKCRGVTKPHEFIDIVRIVASEFVDCHVTNTIEHVIVINAYINIHISVP